MNSKRILLVFVSCLLLSTAYFSCEPGGEAHPSPVNPETIQEARNLLDFLYEISGEYTLSGHHNYTHSLTKYSEQVKEITGKSPVVWGADFSFNFGGKDPDMVRQAMIDTAKLMWEQGHIITLMWHSCFPSDGDSCDSESIWIWEPGVPDAQWDSLTTPGTTLNKQWRDQVDNVAKFLKQLENENVPVLWRPYHEMNGIWFWWCNEKGDDGFVKLWSMMYDRFVNYHNLTNLLWVWNPNAPRATPGDEAYAYEDYFPGLLSIDVLAADVYHNDYRQSHHEQLHELAGQKPIALGEVGKLPSPAILNEQPQWTWFMGWANFITKENSPDSVRALYNAPRVLTMQDIERDKDGNFRVVKGE